MSENMKSRQNRVRRNVTALVSAVALACGTTAVVAPSAGAADVSMNWDAIDAPFEPKIELNTDVQNPLGEFNYVLNFDAQPPQSSQNRQLNLLDLEIWIDTVGGNTELTRDPQPSDIKWASGVTREFPFGVETTEDGRKVIFFGEIPDGDYPVSATFPARIADGGKVPRSARAGIFARLAPEVGWKKVLDRLFEQPQEELADSNAPGSVTHFHTSSDPCRAENYAFYVLDGEGFGQQLVQLYHGVDQTRLRPATANLTPQRTKELESMGYWVQDGFLIKIVDPDGTNITQDVMKRASETDPSVPPRQAFKESATPNWQRAFTWPANVEGDQDAVIDDTEVWLRSGTTIELHQYEAVEPDANGCHLRDSNGEMPNSLNHIVSGRGPVSAGWADRVEFGSPFIGDRVWVDDNGNGLQDAEEQTGVPGVKVIVSRDGEPERVATTNDDGKWLVQDLTAGAKYNVRFVLPTEGEFKDYLVTTTGAGSNRDQDSNGLTFTTDEVPGTGDLTYDLGIVKPASVGDRVWLDVNKDGKRTDDEPGVRGVTVTVSRQGEPDRTATTDKDGFWKVDGLTPGVEYTVTFEQPEGYDLTKTVPNSTDDDDSNGLESKVTLKSGEFNQTYDLGLVAKPASLGDRVWIDANRNGIQDDGEENLSGVTVTVTPPQGSTEQARTVTTDANGNWKVEGLTPGVEYTVVFTLPDGYKATQALAGDDQGKDSNGLKSTVTLKPGEFNQTYDLGVYQTATIGDRVWIDKNGNGIQDEGESGVPNVKVSVREQGRGAGPAVEAVTDKNGNWKVEGLTPGKQYNVRFELPTGYYETVSTAGDDIEKDSNGVSFSTKTLAEGSGGFNLSYDLGLVQPASIGDFVWDDGEYTVKGDDSKVGVKDTDYNGIQNASEKGIANVRVTLTDASGNSVKDINGKTVAPATTDADGKYLFENLRPGTYTVNFSYPQGYEETKSGQGNADTDSNGLTTEVTLESGQSNLTVDLGLVRRNASQTTTTVTNPPTTTPTTTVTKEPTTTPTTTVTKEPTTTPTTTVTKEPTTTPTTTVTKEPTTTPTTTVTTKVTTEKQVPTTVTTQVPTTVTTAGNCKTCTPTTVTSNVPTTIPTTVPTTLTSTTVVPTTVVKTTTNKVVVTDENTAIIGDKVYVDNNGDGKQDPDENEGVPNVTVIVTGKDGEEQRTVTDKDGNWQLVVQPGDYTVKFETDRVPSVPEQVERSIVVKPGEKKDDIDLGVLRPGTVGDRVWEDTNGDGKQDEGEKGVPNVIVKVSRDGEPTRTTYTDENGKWTVEGLTPNTEYRVEFVTPEGWTRTNTPAETVTLKPGATNLDYDLGIKRVPTDKPVQPGQFGGSIVINNPDGSREGVENVIVRATPPAGVDEPVRTSTSDKGGSWTITDLTPDTEYTVTYIIPRGYQVINLPKGATLDKDGNVTVTAKVNRELPTNLGFDLEVERGSSIPGTPTTVTVTETPVTNTTEVQVQSSNDFLAKCWANATQSPFLYLAPIALIGAVGGELARPYMGAVNEQLNQLNAQLQGAFRRDTPEWGDGGRGADREDPFAEFRAQIDAANRQLQQMAADPNIQRLGGIAAGVLALIAAGTIIYDWCSNEPGEAKTASSRRGSAAPTTAPTTSTTTSTTSTEPTPKP